MYAVIISGGKQHRVSEGQTLRLETLEAEVGSEVNFDQVLMIANENDFHIGAPFVKGGKVVGTVVEHGRGKKVHIVKHRRRKHYHKEMGHRQNYTAVKISQIAV